MKTFKNALDKKIIKSLKNNFEVDNYDEYRFGEYNQSSKINNFGIFVKIKESVKNILGYKSKNNRYKQKGSFFVENYLDKLERIWNHLNNQDKPILVELIAYKILGYRKVKLFRNNEFYWKAIETAKKSANQNDTYNPNFMHFILKKFDLNSIGFNIKLYFSEIGIAIDYILEQYAYKLDNKNTIEVKPNDIVLDVGGCWGDTALYFAHKTGIEGKVYSFEFIPENIKLFDKNVALNTILSKRIELVQNPVSNISGEKIYYKDFGPGSTISILPFAEQTGTTETISIDDFVKLKNCSKIDFIKMDIEGSEMSALQGALETIKKFKPKLAIAIYHSMEDFVNIPTWILDLNLDYEIFIGHYTIHSEETICFARPKKISND